MITKFVDPVGQFLVRPKPELNLIPASHKPHSNRESWISMSIQTKYLTIHVSNARNSEYFPFSNACSAE